MAGVPAYYTDFRGGLNSRDAPYLVEDNQARDLQNVQGTVAGAIVKRGGLQTYASPAVVLNSLFNYEAASGAALVGSGATSLYSVAVGGGMSTIKTGLTSGLPWEFIQTEPVSGSGPVYAMNGTDTPQQWTGTGSTAAWTATTGTVPNGKYMVLAGNRLWVSGVAANPSRVYFSDLIPVNNGPLVWPTANVSIFDENDGEAITGLGHVGPYILVTKARKLYVITDMNTGDARRLTDNIGCISHRSIAEAPEGTYFLAEDRGVYKTNGSTLEPISDQVSPTIDAIQTRSKAAGAYFNGHYYLSGDVRGTPGTNDTVLDYDSSLGSWWLHTFGSNQFSVWHPTAKAELFSAKPASAVVDKCFASGVTVDNGTAFTWRWRGPWQSPTFVRRRLTPTPYYKKRFRQLRYDGAGTVDLSLAVDFQGGETLLTSNAFMQSGSLWGGTGTWGDTGIWGDFPAIQRARQYSLGVYNAISVVFSATSTTADQIDSYAILVTDRKDGVVT